MTPRRCRIVCLGAAVMAHVFGVDALPARPIKVQATSYRERQGGSAATAAVAIAALGHGAAFWGCVGTDGDGTRLMARLAQTGVDTATMRQVAGGRTATTAAIGDAQGGTLLARFRGAGLDGDPSWLPLADLALVDGVLADTHWPAGAHAILRAARARGLPCILDATAGEAAPLAELVALSDHAIFAAAGLRSLTGLGDPEAGLRAAQRFTTGLVGVTRDGAPTLWLEDGVIRRQPAFPTRLHAGTGAMAAAAFRGAYALAAACGDIPAAAMRFAAAAAALAGADDAGWSAMPDAAGVAALLDTRVA